MAVKTLEVCKVTPSPSSPAEICIPLAFFDLIWLRFPPVEFLSFYEEAPSLPDTFLSGLKRSLSITLQHFLPLAGNLVWPPSTPTPIIIYKKGDGVSFTLAESDADFCHVSGENFRETKIFRPLVAEITDSDSEVPILAIKVTLFSNKGFSIGFTGHHAALDGSLFAMFLKSWASISKFGEGIKLSPKWTPMFDRTPIRERYPQLENLYISQLLDQDITNPRSLKTAKVELLPDRVHGTFRLSTSDINNLKKFLSKNEEISHDDLVLTTFSVIVAYIIVCSVKATDRMGKKVGFAIVVDCRARLDPPISQNYVGNCIGFASGDVERHKLMGDDGIITALKAVNKMRKGLHDDGVLKGAEEWFLSSDEELETDGISFGGSPNVEFYSLDFGRGRPIKVDVPSIDITGAIGLMGGRDGGIEIELSLSKCEMEKFASAFAQGLNNVKHIRSAL